MLQLLPKLRTKYTNNFTFAKILMAFSPLSGGWNPLSQHIAIFIRLAIGETL